MIIQFSSPEKEVRVTIITNIIFTISPDQNYDKVVAIFNIRINPKDLFKYELFINVIFQMKKIEIIYRQNMQITKFLFSFFIRGLKYLNKCASLFPLKYAYSFVVFNSLQYESTEF